jgi:anti-sigma regulatory factor (Ser/Thr protein kinase)
MSISAKQKIFQHEAFFYSGEANFLAGVVPFIRDAVAADEPVLVAVDEAKIRSIDAALGCHGGLVQYADMAELGRNPACIIPAWRDFVAEHADKGRSVRGIGEPIWKGRSEAELVECHHHESLLNLAFGETLGFWLICPYDAGALDPDVLAEAQRTHPLISSDHGRRPSDLYVAPEWGPGPLESELPEPAEEPEELGFRRELWDVREFVSERAQDAGLEPDRRLDLVLAVSELATNSVLHGGGGGTVRVWREDSALVCEVSDTGQLNQPLLGRERPLPDRSSGRGLWLVNHLCDLVQLRSFPSGSVTRVHMALH